VNQPDLPPAEINPVLPVPPTLIHSKNLILRAGWDLLLLDLLAVVLLGMIYFNISFLAPLRLVLGLVLVLFAPGYALQAALFPRQDDLDGIERAGLSLGLSVAVISLLALLLDNLPWGLRLWPMAISLALTVLVASLPALARRLILPPAKRFIPRIGLDLRSWWGEQDRTNRRLYSLVAGALVITFISAAAILLLPKPAERFTEFYMLGSEGLAQDYPRQVTAGQTVALTVGISNREGAAAVYRIQVKAGEKVLTQAGPVALENGKTWEQALEFVLLTAGDDQQILLLLEREGQPAPYRSLRLWINVKPAAAVP
jgi:uncharacterized membrane protein